MRNHDYFSEAEHYASNEFSNYDGSWDNFSDPYNYANGSGGGGTNDGQVYSNANPANSIPYVLNIANSTTSDVSSVVILGANDNSVGATNFGNAAAITITKQGNVNYQSFLESIKSTPFRIGMIHLQSSNTSQPFQSLTFVNQDQNGRTLSTPIIPVLDPMQQQSGVTIIRQQFVVDAFFEIQTTILASATLTMRLFPMVEVNVARSLNARPVEKDYNRPNLSQYQGGLIG